MLEILSARGARFGHRAVFLTLPDKLNQASPTDLETHPHEASTKVEEVPAEKC